MTFPIYCFLLGYELDVGTSLLIPSHGYPSSYPSNAYVLWTFLFTYEGGATHILFQMSFGYLRLYTGDYLKIGYGWDPSNTSAVVVTYENYNDYPLDLFLSPANIFVEFDTSPTGETSGFQLNLAVRNLSGRLKLVASLMRPIAILCKR